MHAPNSAHHAIHVNCVLSGFTCNRSSPTEPATGMGAKVSERGAKNASETLHDYIAFAFAVRISHQQCPIDWTIGKWILSVCLREEVNWLNYWKCRVKLSENRGKYGTLSGVCGPSMAWTTPTPMCMQQPKVQFSVFSGMCGALNWPGLTYFGINIILELTLVNIMRNTGIKTISYESVG